MPRKPKKSAATKKRTAKSPAKTAAGKPATKKRVMPTFSKPSQHTLDIFDRAAQGVAASKGVERRTMFGYPALFANGNMAVCVFQDRIMLRLSETDRATALAITGAKVFEPSPGRPMREYVDFPPEVLDVPAALDEWVRRGVAYAGGLGAKAGKRKRR